MLESLHISNYALIRQADIRLHSGFNVITGETGAGKSIILGALSLILGGRADTRVVADNKAKTVIEAVFAVSGHTALHDFCEASDIEWDDEKCILRREISSSGRSRAFVNDSPVPLAKLRGVALQLIDIHSQHQNQLLSQPEFQLSIIDALASNQERLRVFQSRYSVLREAVRKLKLTKARIDKSREDEEFTRYQLDQLEALAPLPGEREDLEREREIQANLAQITDDMSRAINSLNADESGVVAQLDRASECVERLDSVIDDPKMLQERLESLRIEAADIAETLESAAEELHGDSEALERIEQRINEIDELCHRHHVESTDQLIAIRDGLRHRLDELDNADATLHELERDARRALALARQAAGVLTEARGQAAAQLAGDIIEKAMPLGMKNLRCEIRVSPADMTPSGSDKVEFLFSFNKNQPLMPVGDTASGGEISRLMLSLKSIIASRMQLPSIIFDEIDTGVSGDVASRMGQMMRQISQSLQVTAITHLPQVAAMADSQYRVFKEDDEEATHTHIVALSPQERLQAIAAMLSGGNVTEAALANAKSLLEAR